jgi:hypothetical protein
MSSFFFQMNPPTSPIISYEGMFHLEKKTSLDEHWTTQNLNMHVYIGPPYVDFKNILEELYLYAVLPPI